MAPQHWTLVGRLADAGVRVEVPDHGLAPRSTYREAYVLLPAEHDRLVSDDVVLARGGRRGGRGLRASTPFRRQHENCAKGETVPFRTTSPIDCGCSVPEPSRRSPCPSRPCERRAAAPGCRTPSPTGCCASASSWAARSTTRSPTSSARARCCWPPTTRAATSPSTSTHRAARWPPGSPGGGPRVRAGRPRRRLRGGPARPGPPTRAARVSRRCRPAPSERWPSERWPSERWPSER